MKLDGLRKGLILPGGGFKCAFQVGALKFFEELGISFDIAQGISGGIMNLSQYFESGSAALEKIWLDVEKKGPGAIFSRIGIVKHFFDNALFSDHGLKMLVNQLNLDKIIANPNRLELVVWNETLEQLEVINNHQFRDPSSDKEILRSFIKASASFPGFFPPETINNQIYSDGCEWVLDSFKDCDVIFIVDPSQSGIVSDFSKVRWDKRVMKRFTSLIDSCTEKELKIFAERYEFHFFPDPESDESIWSGIKRIARLLVGKNSKKTIVVTYPSTNKQSLMLDYFQKGDIPISINHGYERTKEIVGKFLA